MDKQKGKGKSRTMTMKLLVDKSKNIVLFAEAEKECVDFIFSLLAMPVGALVRYLKKDFMDGSFGNVYNSFRNLRSDYLQDNVSKSCLLEPKPAAVVCSSAGSPFLTLNQDSSASKPRGYVKGAVTYMITDDLIVKPLSTISSVTLFNKFNVKDMSGTLISAGKGTEACRRIRIDHFLEVVSPIRFVSEVVCLENCSMVAYWN